MPSYLLELGNELNKLIQKRRKFLARGRFWHAICILNNKLIHQTSKKCLVYYVDIFKTRL